MGITSIGDTWSGQVASGPWTLQIPPLKMELFWQHPVSRLKEAPSSSPPVCPLQLPKAVSEGFPVMPWG